MTVQKTVACESCKMDGVIGVVAIILPVTGGNEYCDVVVSLGWNEVAQGKGVANIHTEGTCPVVGGVMCNLMVLIFNFESNRQISLVWIS